MLRGFRVTTKDARNIIVTSTNLHELYICLTATHQFLVLTLLQHYLRYEIVFLQTSSSRWNAEELLLHTQNLGIQNFHRH